MKKDLSLDTILDHGYDCAWILTGEKSNDFRNKVTALLDWKLRGQVTNVAMGKQKKVTVIPSMGKIPIPFVVIDPSSEPDWATIRETCEGVQWKNLLLVLEDKVSASAPRSYFEKVDIATP